jgi:hypothetical protein
MDEILSNNRVIANLPDAEIAISIYCDLLVMNRKSTKGASQSTLVFQIRFELIDSTIAPLFDGFRVSVLFSRILLVAVDVQLAKEYVQGTPTPFVQLPGV